MNSNILVVIFTYNEQEKISAVLEEVIEKFKNILVVDNNSSDQTLEIIKKYPINYIQHKYNLGKSNSMKTGLDFAEIQNFKYVAFMDGDNQHKTKDLIRICNYIVSTKSDLVIGYRKKLNNLNFSKKIGTILLRTFFSSLFKKKIFDIQCGLRVFKTNEKRISWESNGLRHYFADAEITCSATKNGCKISQIPIDTISSQDYKGMNIIQGLYLLLMLIIWRVS